MIPVAFNVGVSLLTLYLFWRISLLLFHDDRASAASATVVYGLLANSNVYVRHLLACEPALCIGMITLWFALSRQGRWRLALTVGALAGFLVTVYPGYYLFALIPGVVLAGLDESPDLRTRAVRLTGFIVGGAAVIALTEALCRVGGISYLGTVRTLSGTITQGSYDEGAIFVARYLIDVERYAGAVLLAGAILYACRAASELLQGQPLRPIHWLVLSAAAGWAWQAVGSSYAHSMVLYGRLIHPWMAFLVWATGDAIAWTRHAVLRRATWAAVMAASVVSWNTYAFDYVRLAYPADALYALGINTAVLPPSQKRCALKPFFPYDSPGPLNRQTGYPYTNRTDYVLVNFCQGAPESAGFTQDAADVNLPLVFRTPHFMAFGAYGFEGLTEDERRWMKRPAYDLRVYGLTVPAPFQRPPTAAAR